MASILPPVSPAVGLNSDFISEKGGEIVLKEKTLAISGDDFTITDLDGNVVMRCRGKAASVHAKKFITSADGRQLFRIDHQVGFGREFSYLAYDEHDNQVFSVQKGRSPVKQIIRFRNFSTQSDIALSIVKDSGYEAHIVIGDAGAGETIAHITRKNGLVSNIMCAQTYFVTMAPGVDSSLVAALTVCYDHTRQVVAPATTTVVVA